MSKETYVLTINSEFPLTYEQLIIAAMKVDWYRRPDDTLGSTKRKFVESLTNNLREEGYRFFHLEPFTTLKDDGRDWNIEYNVDPADWIDQREEYDMLIAATDFINELF